MLLFPLLVTLRNNMTFTMRPGHSPFYVFLLCILTCTPFPLLFPLEIEHQCVLFSDSGTVEAGAGAGGEGVKRKRSDEMAALEVDLAPEPQAGMTQSPVSVSSPHLYQRSLPLSQHMPSSSVALGCCSALLLASAARASEYGMFAYAAYNELGAACTCYLAMQS